MSRGVILAWTVGVMVFGTFVVFRIIIPSLVNSHSTPALIGAVLLGAVTLTADFLIIKQVGSLWAEAVKEHENEED
jgi:hypothetical protein